MSNYFGGIPEPTIFKRDEEDMMLASDSEFFSCCSKIRLMIGAIENDALYLDENNTQICDLFDRLTQMKKDIQALRESHRGLIKSRGEQEYEKED